MKVSELFKLRSTVRLPENEVTGRRVRYILYGRYSADTRRRTNSKSAEQQNEVSADWCLGLSGDIVGRFTDEARSGYNMNRPGLIAALEMIDKGLADVILVTDASRLTRSVRDGVTMLDMMERAGVELHCVGVGKLDRSVAIALIVQAEAGTTYSKTASRVALRKLVRSGLNISRAPYGYRVDPDSPGRLVKVADEQEVIHYVVRSVLEGRSVANIARSLNARKVPRRFKGIWCTTNIVGTAMVPGLLRQPILAGYLVTGRRTVKRAPDTGKRVLVRNDQRQWVMGHGPEIACIDEDTYDRIQDILDSDKRRAPRERQKGRQNVMSMKVRCHECGGSMKGCGQNKTTAYVNCRVAELKAGCSNTESIRTDVLIDMLVARIRSLQDEGTLESLAVAAGDRQMRHDKLLLARNVRSAERNVDKTDTQIARLMQLVLDGRGVESVNGRVLTDLEARRSSALRDLDAAKLQLRDLESAVLPLDRVRTALRDLRPFLSANDNGGKIPIDAQDAFRALFDSVTVEPTETTYKLAVSGLIAFEAEVERRGRGRPRSGVAG